MVSGIQLIARYRASTFGHALGPWRHSRALAQQDAIDSGEGLRDLDTGQVYLTAPALIEQDDGAAPMTPDQERYAEALAVLNMYGGRARVHAAERIQYLREQGEPYLEGR